jgi:hypothetical protein
MSFQNPPIEDSNKADILTLPRWYAVHSRSRFEKKITLLLEEKGIDCYLPIKKLRESGKTGKKLLIFLFSPATFLFTYPLLTKKRSFRQEAL